MLCAKLVFSVFRPGIILTLDIVRACTCTSVCPVGVSLSLTAHMFVGLSYIFLSVCLSVCPSVCQSGFLSVFLSVGLSSVRLRLSVSVDQWFPTLW